MLRCYNDEAKVFLSFPYFCFSPYVKNDPLYGAFCVVEESGRGDTALFSIVVGEGGLPHGAGTERG